MNTTERARAGTYNTSASFFDHTAPATMMPDATHSFLRTAATAATTKASTAISLYPAAACHASSGTADTTKAAAAAGHRLFENLLTAAQTVPTITIKKISPSAREMASFHSPFSSAVRARHMTVRRG